MLKPSIPHCRTCLQVVVACCHQLVALVAEEAAAQHKVCMCRAATDCFTAGNIPQHLRSTVQHLEVSLCIGMSRSGSKRRALKHSTQCSTHHTRNLSTFLVPPGASTLAYCLLWQNLGQDTCRTGTGLPQLLLHGRLIAFQKSDYIPHCTHQ